MISELEYIKISIESDLFYTRIMMDHAIFLEIMVSSFNSDAVNTFIEEKEKYARLLHMLLDVGNGLVSKEFIENKVLVTEFTKDLENKTKDLFNIFIDNSITEKSLKIVAENGDYVTGDLIDIIDGINAELLKSVNETIDILIDLDKMVRENEVYLFSGEDLVSHFIKETRIFKIFLEFIREKYYFTPTYIYNNMYYFNDCFKDHSNYIKNVLYPVNNDLAVNIYKHLNNYNLLFSNFNNEISPNKMNELSDKGLSETKDFKDYGIILTNSILKNKFNLVIPLSCDHIIRESSIYITNLEMYNGNKE